MKSERRLVIARRFQRGISIPAILGILAVVTVLALAFLAIVNNQNRATQTAQGTITAGYVAEIGFQEVRAQLGALDGEWSDLKDENGVSIVKDCATSNPKYLRCQRMPDDNNFSEFFRVRENPLDANSRIIGIYEVAIETGQKRTIFGNKTLTGASRGYVPGSNDPNEQAGYDVYGNKLCDQSVAAQTCPGGFLGIKVTGWLTDSSGRILPRSRAQTSYGVLQLDSRDLDDEGPSNYMLESDQAIQIFSSSEWDQSTWSWLAHGGFYGPLHTNEHYEFEWESTDETNGTYQVTKGAANSADLAAPGDWPGEAPGPGRPFLGLLMADIGVQWNIFAAPRLYEPLDDLTYFPYGKFWMIDWGAWNGSAYTLNGPEPAPGSTYNVAFRRSDMTIANLSVTKGPANGMDFITSPLNVPYQNGPLVSINQGATTYAWGSSMTYRTDNMIDWKLVDPSTMTVIGNGSDETVPGNSYRARYISHAPIRVSERMTYANDPPVYRYWHTHAMNTGSPLYQAGHGHNNVMGANFSVNSTAYGADPGYDSTTWRHSHYITNDVSVNPIPVPTGTPVPNTYLQFANPAFVPTSSGRHEMPLLRPEADITNYKNQLEQLNKYLQLTLGTTLPRNPDGTLDASALANPPFNATDYARGYIVGKFPSTHPATTPAEADFRAVYFGNDLKYSAGGSSGADVLPANSAYDLTAWIWVDDNPSSANYMKVAASQVDGNFKRYLYRQIPPGKVLMVRDAAVLIGNFKPQSGNCISTYKAHCLDYHAGFVADPPGQATIVDGQLSIFSFTTSPPLSGQEHKYNKGDIIVVGNVRYRNDFYALPSDKTQMRQLDPQPTAPYSRSNTLGGAITGISDGAVMWTTRTDGTRYRDAITGLPVGKLCGLGLFATYDIKISVTPLYRPGYEDVVPPPSTPNTPDSITINGQLVAGNKVWVHGDDQSSGLPYGPDDYLPDDTYFSNIDKLSIYGTIYSREKPNFSEYFRVRRDYFFDKSLKMNPLMGAPYYPENAGDYRNQNIYSEFPKLVQGTWIQGAN